MSYPTSSPSTSPHTTPHPSLPRQDSPIGLETLLYPAPHSSYPQWQKRIVAYIFRRFIRDGNLRLDFNGDCVGIHSGTSQQEFTIRPPRLWALLKILINPDFYGLETYTRGNWSSQQPLVDFLSFIGAQRDSSFNKWWQKVQHLPSPKFFFKQYITPIQSTRRAHTHYDVPPQFYQYLLCPQMLYSCAFFENSGDDLQIAQARKLNRLFERANLHADAPSKILDIGCGWGGTAVALAQQYPHAQVDGISIAAKQIEYANATLCQKHPQLQTRVAFHLSDYCLYRPQESDLYDHIISVGMLEHVGKTKYANFFCHVNRLLKPGGSAVIHTIIRRESGKTNAWIDKNVFHGGYIPQIQEVLDGISKSPLQFTAHYEHAGDNYYKTLECWKQNLLKNYFQMLAILTHPHKDAKNTRSQQDFRRWYAYLSGAQSFFLPHMGNGGVCHFVVQKAK